MAYRLPSRIPAELAEWLQHADRQAPDSPAFRKELAAQLEALVDRHTEDFARFAMQQERALTRIARRGLNIKTVIDVGASDGSVAALMQSRFWSEAQLFCIEGFEHWRPGLEERKRTTANFDFVIAAAGDKPGKIYFLQNPDRPTTGHALDRKPDDRYVEVAQVSIDDEITRRSLPPPYLIKLDTHGREGEILEGATRALAQTSLLMIEANNFADRGRMRFHELCAFVEERGFRCADLAEPTFRKSDQMLWQLDLFFLRKDDPVFTSAGYS